MPLELGIWRIDEGLKRLTVGSLDQEARPEAILDQFAEILQANLYEGYQ